MQWFHYAACFTFGYSMSRIYLFPKEWDDEVYAVKAVPIVALGRIQNLKNRDWHPLLFHSLRKYLIRASMRNARAFDITEGAVAFYTRSGLTRSIILSRAVTGFGDLARMSNHWCAISPRGAPCFARSRGTGNGKTLQVGITQRKKQ